MVTFSERQLRSHGRRRREEYGDWWSNIASDLLECIQKKLPLPDILPCRSVCRSWRSVTKTHLVSLLKPPHHPPSPPLILWKKNESDSDSSHSDSASDNDYNYGYDDDDDDDYYDHNYYNEEDEEEDEDEKEVWCFIDVLKTDGGNLYIPEKQKFARSLARMEDCVGYSHGYFLFTDGEEQETLYLFHPTLFSRRLLRLPLITFPTTSTNDINSIHKAILCADPICGNVWYRGIALIQRCTRKLFFAKCGDTQFMELEGQDIVPIKDGITHEYYFEDIICVKNYIYAITDVWNKTLCMKAWDCSCIGENQEVPKKVLDFPLKLNSKYGSLRALRLLESEGEILLVAISYLEPRRVKAKSSVIDTLWVSTAVTGKKKKKDVREGREKKEELGQDNFLHNCFRKLHPFLYL